MNIQDYMSNVTEMNLFCFLETVHTVSKKMDNLYPRIAELYKNT